MTINPNPTLRLTKIYFINFTFNVTGFLRPKWIYLSTGKNKTRLFNQCYCYFRKLHRYCAISLQMVMISLGRPSSYLLLAQNKRGLRSLLRTPPFPDRGCTCSGYYRCFEKLVLGKYCTATSKDEECQIFYCQTSLCDAEP